jgi:hypothetical protein
MNDEQIKLAMRVGGIIFTIILLLQLWPYVVGVLALIGAACVYEQTRKR